MEPRYCIECEDVFLSDDFTDVLCPDCRGESDNDGSFTAARKSSKTKRAMNRECSAEILKKHDVPFDVKNDGAHLIVKHDGKIVDFWPGTGKFIFRQGNNQGRGVFTLLKRLGIQEQ